MKWRLPLLLGVLLLAPGLVLGLVCGCSDGVLTRSGLDGAGGDSEAGTDAGAGSDGEPGWDGSMAIEPPTCPPEPLPDVTVDWQDERYVPEDFTGSSGGGPSWGPVEQVGAGVSALTGDKAGRLYLVNGQTIDVVDSCGMRYRLAGTGESGYEDGPADRATFRIGVGAYYGAHNIQADERGNIFVADTGNRVIRRIFKSVEGVWTVDTWAGGGAVTPRVGESAPARDVKLIGTLIIAVGDSGQMTIATQYSGAWRVDADGSVATYLGRWPAYEGAPTDTVDLAWQGGDGDDEGNAYFVARTPDVAYRVDTAGQIEHIGGLPSARDTGVGDGPPLTIYFDTPSSGAACADGGCVYVCGGDEYAIRRIPTDLESTSSTLAHNGRWYVMESQPEPTGRAEFDADAAGPSRYAGGSLHELINSHLVGRDEAGHLYGYLYEWVGFTQHIVGRGELGTRIYRLRRTH